MFFIYRKIQKSRREAVLRQTANATEDSIPNERQSEIDLEKFAEGYDHLSPDNNLESFHGTTTALSETLQTQQAEEFKESDAGDGTAREDHYLQGFRLYTAYFSLIVAIFVVAIDQTITLTILSILTERLDAGDKITWVSAAFTLGMAVTVQFWGTFSIATGRKYALCAAISVFEIGSLVSALAQSMNMLIVGRVVQGLGAGGIQNITYIIISEIFPINKRSMALVGYTAIFSASSSLGPLIGGNLSSISWRWCFYINLPIGGAAILILFFLYNPPRPRGHILENLKKIDVVGVLVFGGSVAMILVGLTLPATGYKWSSVSVICCLVIGVFTFVLFGVWNFFISKYPLFPKHIMRVIAVQACFWGYFWGWGCFMAVVQFLAIYFEVMFSTTPGMTGVSLLCILVPSVLASAFAGRFISRTGFTKPLAILAGILMVVGSGLLTLLSTDSTSSMKIGLPICLGAGVGLVTQPILLGVQVSAPSEAGSTILASSYITVGRNLGASVCSALAQITYSTTLNKRLIASGLTKIYSYKQLTSDYSLFRSLSRSQQIMLGNAYMGGIRNVFFLAIGLGALALISALFMSNKKVPKKTKE